MPITTSAAISNMTSLQAAFSVIAALDVCAPCYPSNADVPDGCSFDYVVVGGGNAGSVVAARLVEAGHSVLIIEAGGLPRLESIYPAWMPLLRYSRADWNFTFEEENVNVDRCHKYKNIPGSKGMGGIGTTDFMIYNRGDPTNYVNWSKDGAWSWKNMTKYFKRSESLQDKTILNSAYGQYHGTCGKIRITRECDDITDEYIEGFKRAGQPAPIDNIGNGSLGFSRALYYIYDGQRTSVKSYITPLKDNPKLSITLYSLATKIIFDDKKNAVGVEFIKNGTKITVKAKKEVIISAGPFKSSQLLMLSGIGPKNQLKKFKIKTLSDLPVGQSFQNIIGTYLVFKTNKKAEPKKPNPRKIGAPLITGYVAIDPKNKSSKYSDYELLNVIVDNYNYFLANCGFLFNFNNNICDQIYRQGKSTQLMVTVLNNLHPKSRGKILLNSSNPMDQPRIITSAFSEIEDLDDTVTKIQHFMKLVSTPYFKDMGLELLDASKCSKYKKGSKDYWTCYALCMIVGNQRHVGSNAMGVVVDSELCVMGTDRLRVVDASVIPNTICGSIPAVIIAVAEKAAEMIIADA